MTIYYEPGDFNELTVLLRWRGTIMPAVLMKPVVWLLMAFHCGMLYLSLYKEVSLPMLPWKRPAAHVPLVFPSSRATASRATTPSTPSAPAWADASWHGLPARLLPKGYPTQLWNLSRFVVASVYVLYFQLAGGASDGKLVTDQERMVLVQTQLLSHDGVKLKGYRGQALPLPGVGAAGDRRPCGRRHAEGGGCGRRPVPGAGARPAATAPTL